MMRRKLAALLAAILFGTAAVPTTIAYAQGNDPDAAAVTEVTETKRKILSRPMMRLKPVKQKVK